MLPSFDQPWNIVGASHLHITRVATQVPKNPAMKWHLQRIDVDGSNFFAEALCDKVLTGSPMAAVMDAKVNQQGEQIPRAFDHRFHRSKLSGVYLGRLDGQRQDLHPCAKMQDALLSHC